MVINENSIIFRGINYAKYYGGKRGVREVGEGPLGKKIKIYEKKENFLRRKKNLKGWGIGMTNS